MKKIILWVSAIVCIAAATACTSINSSDAGDLAIYPKTVEPTDNYRPLYKIDTKKRVNGSANVNILFGIFMWGDNAGVADNASIDGGFFSFLPNWRRLAAQAAFYDACKKANCDAVVSARYEIVSKDYIVFKKSKVEVKGFPATLTGVDVVKPVQYYIDANGNIVLLDDFINPIKIFDARVSSSRHSGFWFFD